MLLIVSLLLVASASAAPIRSTDNNTYLMRLQTCSGVHTLHGLWPNWAEDCTTEPLNIDILKNGGIYDDMNQYWPSCVGSDTNEEFWSHEWSKHGTCSGLDQLSYFSMALKLRAQYADQSGDNFCFAREDFSPVTCPAAMIVSM